MLQCRISNIVIILDLAVSRVVPDCSIPRLVLEAPATAMNSSRLISLMSNMEPSYLGLSAYLATEQLLYT